MGARMKRSALTATDRDQLTTLTAAQQQRARDNDLALRLLAAIISFRNGHGIKPTLTALRAALTPGDFWVAEARRLGDLYAAAGRMVSEGLESPNERMVN
jgi:hypothetical protein